MKLRTVLIGTLTALAVISCGGGGGGTTAGGIGGTGISYGPVSGFGSVVVNGTRYSTTGTGYNGEISSASDLAVGMVVTVQHNGGGASLIDYRDNVEGPVANRNVTGNTMTVLGLAIQINSLTVFENSTGLAGTNPLNDSDIVEVSGLIVATNTVRATRVERKSTTCPNPVGGVEVKGTVLGRSGDTFLIGSLTVDFSTALLNDGTPADGDYVEVKASSCPSGVTLIASSVELATQGLAGDTDTGDELELKGFVANRSGSCTLASCSFTLNGQQVSTSTATQLQDGTIGDLVNGALIEAEGDVNSGGVLVASTIEFESEEAQDSEIEIKAIPTSKSRTAFNVGSLTLLDLVAQVNTSTQFEGGSISSPFNLDTVIANSTCLEVKLFDAGGNGLVATNIKTDNDCGEVELQGPAASINNPDFAILGIDIETSGSTQFKDSAGNSMSQSAFFSAISTGTVVKAEGSYSTGVLTASQAEIED